MPNRRTFILISATTAFIAYPHAASALHSCDALGNAGWSVVATVETIDQTASAPYQITADGHWFVDRTTTLLPMCSYYSSLGVYSLRSYSLSPERTTERIEICRDSIAIAPYRGPCPPK